MTSQNDTNLMDFSLGQPFAIGGFVYNFIMRIAALCLVCLAGFKPSLGQAYPNVNCKKSQFDRISDFVQKTKVFGTDDRKTFDEYAALQGKPVSVIEKKFQATGILDCEGSQSTAQLTESNSVITFSRHIFKDADCKDIPDRSSRECVFYTHDGSGWNVSHALDMKSLKMGECVSNSSENDWAVMKLKRPAKGIKPYKAISADEISSPVTVLNPAAFSGDFSVNGEYPRIINECSITQIELYARTTCDTGRGASGSANLVDDGNNGLSLVAIAIGTGTLNTKDVNISAPLKGEFYNAVMAAAGKKTNTASTQSKDKGI